jgi:uncharacterized phiE125 gp8 family phage protein
MAQYGLTLTTAPAKEPVTLDEAKVQCGVAQEVGYHDAALKGWIAAARAKVEEDTGRALITQTWDLSLDCWPTGLTPIYLMKPPVSSVGSIKYYDTSNVEQTLSTNVYKVLTARQPCEVHLKYQQQWPSLYSEASVITIRFVCGYGTAETSVPDGLKAAMKLLISNWFNNPSATVTGTIQTTTEIAYQALINQFLVGDEFHCYAR